MGTHYVSQESQATGIRCPLRGANIKRALIQRGTDMITCEDWKTLDLEEEKCEAVDLITGEPPYFHRAVEATTTATE